MRVRSLAVGLVACLLVAGLAQSAPSRVEVAMRGPQAQQPDLSAGDDDTAKPGMQVRPTAGGSKGVPADVIVYDENGHNDIRKVNVTVLRPDNATVHRGAVDASKLSGNGTRATWRATVTMQSDDPPGTYIVRASVLDRDAAVTLAWTNFTYEPLAALTLAQDNLSLGPSSGGLKPGADTSASPLRVNVTNGGNINVSLTVSGTSLANATYEASIPASNLRASRSADMSAPLTLSGTAQDIGGAAVAPNATAALHFSVLVPEGLRPGDYVGELTLGAVAAS